MNSRPLIQKSKVSALKIPTKSAEADGTFRWNSTTLVLVELEAGNEWGVGYTYAHACTADLVKDLLNEVVLLQDAFDIPKIWGDLVRAERNLGRVGLGAMAVSAIDTALWDLKAKLLGLPLARLLGSVRSSVPVYGSGGFTSYTREEVKKQLLGWEEEGIEKVKMKIGLGVEEDLERIAFVRKALAPETALFVDANEAYQSREALWLAERMEGVDWFEQPIQAEDIEGMRFLRDHFPPALRLTTGEYLSDTADFREILIARAADVLQPDVTRCRGITGFLKAAALCESFNIPVSSHCAPSLHLALGCAIPNFLHMEYFFDHVRIERLVFDHDFELENGCLAPDWNQPGLGIEFKRKDAERYAA
jgi:L-alanine-DL-glutamate epimerase-like enolase superfamily enzyme